MFFLIMCFLLLAPVFLPAQTAAELEALLETPAVTCSQAAWFVYASERGDASKGSGASGGGGAFEKSDSADISSPETAFERAKAKGWLPKTAAPDDPISLGALSFVMMKAFDIKGGLLYTIFPGPRYAFRTMVSRSLIQGAADPDMKVSGDRFLQILGNTLDAEGGEP